MKSREELILQEARRLFLADGYLGMNMDRLAEAVEYSKPTIYGHFTTKEDLLLAICNDSLRQRVELFIRAASFQGRSRERMCAIGMADLVFACNYREHYEVEKLMKTASLWEKATPERRAYHERLDHLCMNTMAGIVGSAFVEGDLDPKQTNPQAIYEGLRSISIGTHIIISFRERTPEEVSQLFLLLRENQMRFLDGWNWLPLTKTWNYHETMQRIGREIFPTEIQAIPAPLQDTTTFRL